MIAPAEEAEPLNELRAVLGNTVAINAYRTGALPFPDGTVLVKLAWKHVQSPDLNLRPFRELPRRVQVMVKDSKKYAENRRLGILDALSAAYRFDEAQHQTCFACHDAARKHTTTSLRATRRRIYEVQLRRADKLNPGAAMRPGCSVARRMFRYQPHNSLLASLAPSGETFELRPHDLRMNALQAFGLREAAIGAGDQVLLADDLGEIDDALGDQLWMLHRRCGA